MANISKINGYNIKDAVARNGVGQAMEGVSQIGEGLDALSTRFTGMGNSTNQALGTLEQNINALNNRCNEFDEGLTTMNNALTGFREQQEANTTQIAENKTAIEENGARISELAQDVSSQDEKITEIQSEITELKDVKFGVVKSVVTIPANTTGSGMSKLYDVKISLPDGNMIEDCEFWYTTEGLNGMNCDQYVSIVGKGNTETSGYVNFRVTDAPFYKDTDLIIKLFYMKVGGQNE